MAGRIVEVVRGKPRITLDFDGVLNGNQSQHDGDNPTAPIPDPPVPGSREAVAALRAKGYEVVVLSARTSDNPKSIETIRAYLTKHGIEVDAVVDKKLPSRLYVDDRGFRFEGDWNAVLAFLEQGAQPWHKR